LTDSNKKVRRHVFLAFLGIMENESKCSEFMPYLLPLLSDRSKFIRRYVAGYLCYEDYFKYVPLDRVARAVVNEKDPEVQKVLIELMRTVLDSQTK